MPLTLPYRTLCIALLCLALLAMPQGGLFASDRVGAAHTSFPLRIAYLEEGPFWLFEKSYAALREALSRSTGHSFIFPSELHLSLGWNTDTRQLEEAARDLLSSEADMVVAAGTKAAHALTRMASISENRALPILGMALADPVASGLVLPTGQGAYPTFLAEIQPDRWRSMFRVFHVVVDFQVLGVMYPQGPEGSVYTALENARAMATERGFSLVEVTLPDESVATCRDGIDELHRRGAQAFFIPPLVCFDWSSGDPTALIRQLHEYGMPSFARDGSHYVQGGAFMGFATWDFAASAQRLAVAMERIADGTAPGEIRLVISPQPSIALNLQSARELGIVLPLELLLSADELYKAVQLPAGE